jgi:hypothetical protein
MYKQLQKEISNSNLKNPSIHQWQKIFPLFRAKFKNSRSKILKSKIQILKSKIQILKSKIQDSKFQKSKNHISNISKSKI